MKTKYYVIGFLLLSGVLISARYIQTDPWIVPAKSDKMVNPVKSDDESIKLGKSLWAKHCLSCHGKTGQGDGTKAAQLETEMEDFMSADVQKQTDGALFYKIQVGRDEMPSFEKKIPDEDEIWALVNYVRTMKAK